MNQIFALCSLITHTALRHVSHAQLLHVLKTSHMQQCNYAPRLWNELPDNIKAADSVQNFKKQLKTLLFRKEFNWLYGPWQLSNDSKALLNIIGGKGAISSINYYCQQWCKNVTVGLPYIQRSCLLISFINKNIFQVILITTLVWRVLIIALFQSYCQSIIFIHMTLIKVILSIILLKH